MRKQYEEARQKEEMEAIAVAAGVKKSVTCQLTLLSFGPLLPACFKSCFLRIEHNFTQGFCSTAVFSCSIGRTASAA